MSNSQPMDIRKIGEELLSVVFKHETFPQKREVGVMLLNRINEMKLRQKHRMRMISYSVAASIAIFVAVGSYVVSDKQFRTQDATLAIVLPDNSKVQLGVNSSLSYNSILWLFERNVGLKGDARFKVISGEQFTVQTASGDVRVLGTEFSVSSSDEKLYVECFEGSVEVATPRGENTLHKGDVIHCTPTENIFTPQPEYYEYRHESVADVLTRIEKIYGVTVPAKENYRSIIFDGAITTQSLTGALDVLTMSCDMNYSIKNNMITITVNE